MTIKDYTGTSGVVYSTEQYRGGLIPTSEYPLRASYVREPEPEGPPPIIHVIPLDLWNDPDPPFAKWETKMLVLDREDVKVPEFEPIVRRTIEGYTMIAEGSPYFFDGLCPHCATKLSSTGDSNSSWTHNYVCPGCSRIVIVDEGDKMGGGFDHWELFTKNQTP